MKKIKLLSMEECQDKVYGKSVVQYQEGDMVSFAFSEFSPEEIKRAPSIAVAELMEKERGQLERPRWAALSPKLLEAVLENPFDMHFVEYDDDGYSADMETALWDEVRKVGIRNTVSVGEDDALITVYAGAMGSINWKDHPHYGKPCFEHFFSDLDILREKVAAERKEFKEPYIYGQYEPNRAYEDWYIIGFYEAYSELLTCDYLEGRGLDDEISWLASMDRPLDFLYDLWMDCDEAFSHDWDDMIDFICANYLEVSQEKVKMRLEAQIDAAAAQKAPEKELDPAAAHEATR